MTYDSTHAARQTHGRRGALGLSVAVALLMLALAVAPSLTRRADAAGLVNVSTTAIANDPNDGKCDLWEALQAIFQANDGLSPTYHECTASMGPNVVMFVGAAAGGTISIGAATPDLPFVWGDTTIMGPVTIAGGSGVDTHFFRLAGNAILTLNGVTLQNGYTSGGGAAILDTNHATVNIFLSSLTGNSAANDGGAINSNGTVNIVNSSFSGNQARGLANGSGAGGAIAIDGNGSLNVSQSNFAGNIAGRGGAIYVVSGVAAISDAALNGNISNPITPTLLSGGGGAVYVDANTAINIVRTAFSGNLSPASNGGALFVNISANTVISDTSFNANIAGTPSAAQLGGALYNQGALSIQRSAFLNNISASGDGGGLVVDRASSASVANTTFAANLAPFGNGGGIVVTQTQIGGPASSLIARNVTLWTNAAKPVSGKGGNLWVAAGQSVSLGNTILSGGVGGNCFGTVASAGHNIDSGSDCALSQTGDLSSTDPKLDTPAHNGGPIASLLSQKLLFGSPAIDAGDNALCAAPPVNNEDQNGDSRPQDGDNNGTAICDIGAVENGHPLPGYGSTPVQPGPINFGNAQVGTPITGTFTAQNTGDFPLTLANPSMGGTNPGDFTRVTAFPIVLNPGDTSVVTLLCTPSASGTRTATFTFNSDDPKHLSLSYNLTCNGTAAPTAGFGSVPAAPGPVSFSTTVVGKNSSASITVQQTGNATLNVTGAALSGPNAGDFSVLTAVPFSIVVGGAAKFLIIQCTPSDVGLRTAVLTLTTNDPNQGSPAFNLACPGTMPPSPLFAPGTSIVNPNKSLNGVYGVAVSPDGQNVYATSYFSGSVSSFSRKASGALTFIAQDFVVFNLLAGARQIAMSPDGKFAYATGQLSSSVVTFARQKSGDLVAIHAEDSGTYSGLAGATGVALSLDGRFVYVTGYSANAVVVFSRDASTGLLTYLQTVTSAADLSGAHGLMVSPDGANLYVTGYISSTEGTLAVYKRDALAGTLTHLETWKDTPGPCFIFCVYGLNGAYQVAVSPDGSNVYVVGTYELALAVFQRDTYTGRLNFMGAYINGYSGVSGLNGVSGVTLTPNGLHVITTGFNDKAVSVFDRDPSTGWLTFNQMIQRNPFSGPGGDPPLDGAREVHTSPDGQNVYAAGFNDDAVAVLGIANPAPQIDNINPSSSVVGSPAFTMLINGHGFSPASQARINGFFLPTTYVNPQQLSAVVSAIFMVGGGGKTVDVQNPAPGGGTSNVVTFTVVSAGQNPLPSIDHLTPQGAPAGSGAFSLQIAGSNFLASSVVKWNGQNRTTHFVNGNTLTADIAAADIGQPGIAAVTVFNGGPGGGTSNAVAFTSAAPGQNPAPSLTQLSPAWVFSHGAGSQSFTLLVSGLNFVNGAIVQWNGLNRPTKFINGTTLQATITPADSAFPGSVGVSVFNPAPGGGGSNALTFIVRKLYPLFVPLIRR